MTPPKKVSHFAPSLLVDFEKLNSNIKNLKRNNAILKKSHIQSQMVALSQFTSQLNPHESRQNKNGAMLSGWATTNSKTAAIEQLVLN